MELGPDTMSSSSSPNVPLMGAGDEETNIILNHVVEVFPRTAHMQQLLAKKMEEERQQRAEEEARRLLQMKEEMERRQKDEEFRKRKQQKKKLRDIEDKKRREEEMKNRDDDSLSQVLRMCINNEAPQEISFSGLGLKEVQLRVLVRDGLGRNHTIVALGAHDFRGNQLYSGGDLSTELLLLTADLRRAGLTDDTGPTIAHMLHTNTCLKKLCLEGNHLGLASARAFRRALEVNHTLRSLNVENCNFTCRGDEQAGVEELARGLRVNRGLLNLNLRNNQIDDEGGDALLEAMATNTTLIQLDVSGNDLSLEQLRELQRVVDRNRARFVMLKKQERQERMQMGREEELMHIFVMHLEARRVSVEGAERRRIAREKERFELWMDRAEADEKEQDEAIQTLQKAYEDRKAALVRRKKGSKKKGNKKA